MRRSRGILIGAGLSVVLGCQTAPEGEAPVPAAAAPGAPQSGTATPAQEHPPTATAAVPAARESSPPAKAESVVSTAAFESVGPPVPPPRPMVSGALAGFEAAVEGESLILRARLQGTAVGAGELDPAAALDVTVTLLGPGEKPLVGRDGKALELHLAPGSTAAIAAGPVGLALEGKLPLADLLLAGSGLHQVAPELVRASCDGARLTVMEQFPYVWITRTENMPPPDGINDARVVASGDR